MLATAALHQQGVAWVLVQPSTILLAVTEETRPLERSLWPWEVDEARAVVTEGILWPLRVARVVAVVLGGYTDQQLVRQGSASLDKGIMGVLAQA